VEFAPQAHGLDYKKLAPLAMIATLPKAEKPGIQWIMQCVQLSLQAVRNRLHWDDAVSFSDDDTANVELHHVGLGVVNLDAMPLHRVAPHETSELAPAQLEHMTPEQLEAALPNEEAGPLSCGDEGHEPGMLSLLKTVAVVSRDFLQKGVTHPLSILEVMLKKADAKRSGRPTSVDDYARLFATLERPWFADRFESDEVFAYLRVAGFNPLVLKQVKAPGENFPVTDEQFRVTIHDAQDSLALAGAEGRLFLCDYAALAGVKNGNFPVGPKYCFAPLALFALPRGGSGPRRLHPVAIQCG
jgi:arachidonate 15-lipoxygenase